MIPFLIGLTVVGVVGGLAGIYYAKQERSSKRMPNQPRLPLYKDEDERFIARAR